MSEDRGDAREAGRAPRTAETEARHGDPTGTGAGRSAGAGRRRRGRLTVRVRRLHRWDVAPGRAREIQSRLRDRVVPEPPPGFDPETVAGGDVSVGRGRGRGWAGFVTVDTASMETVDEGAASADVAFPYVPGLLSFRELPALARAWRELGRRPDALILDGHGRAHPRRFGLACHAGLVLDVPAVGCAKSVLVGEHDEPGAEEGSTAALRHEGETVGTAVRTRTDVRPVYVSVGHRVDLETAVELVLGVSPRYRVPEPVRRADRLVGDLRRRDEAT